MASESRMAGDSPGGPWPGYQSGHARPAASSGCRDIFPLPMPPEVKRIRRVSRRDSQKIAREVQDSRRCREAVASLNWLAGRDGQQNSLLSLDALQTEVLRRVRYLSGLCHDKGSLDRVPTPEAALSALLRGRSEYGSDPPTALATCSLERISLPENVANAPSVESLLDESALRYLQCPEHMLKPEGEGALDFQPYWDPLLRKDASLYKRFIRKLDKAGFLVYTLRPKCRCGIFFVKKSDGKRLRMIVDARGTNTLFRAPPGVDLLTSDGFSRIELMPPEHLEPGSEAYEAFMCEQKIAIGLSDIRDCFHRLRQPAWLSEYFSLDPVPAGVVGLTGSTLCGKELSAEDLIYPCPGSLCMGFKWSLYFAQRVSERLMSRVPSLARSSLANDRSGSIVFDQRTGCSSKASMHHYVSVDNLGVLTVDHVTAQETIQEVEAIFTSHKLLLHPGEVSQGSTRALGCDLRGDLLASRVTPERYHNLHQALNGVLGRKKVSGRLLEIVVGHATFVGLMNRPVLSVFNTVYRYIRSHYSRPSVLWPSVREELAVFKGLMVFLHADWCRPWNKYVTATDSSMQGFGVVSSYWEVDDVASVGRELERSRFKKLGMHSARDSALTAAGFIKDEATQEWRAGWATSDEYLTRSGWALNREFKEVPGRLLRADDWTPRLWGKWAYDAGILELEARALVKGIRRIALSTFGHDIRQLILADNMSVCLAFDRARARSYQLLKQIRHFSAYLLSRNIACTVRWVPSELNNADKPSRLDLEDDSKLLTHVLPAIKSQEGTTVEAPVRGSAKGPGQEPISEAGGASGPQVIRNSPESPKGRGFGELPDDSTLKGEVQPGRCRDGSDSTDHPEEDSGRQPKSVYKCYRVIGTSECEEEETPTKSQEASQSTSRQGVRGRGYDIPRGQGYRRQNFEAVPRGIPGLSEVRQAPGLGHQERLAHGRAPPGLHEPVVCGGASELQSGSSDGGLHAQSRGLWPPRKQETPEDMARPEGLQKADARPHSCSFSLGSVGGLCCPNVPTRNAADGPFLTGGGLDLCTPVRIAEGQNVQSYPPGRWRNQRLVAAAFPRGGKAELENGGLQRVNPLGQPLAKTVERQTLRLAEMLPPHSSSVGLRLPGVCRDLPRDCLSFQCGGHPVPNQALGSLNRPGQKLPKFAPSPTERAVESPQECGPVRKERDACKELWENLTPSFRAYAQLCEQSLGEILLGRAAAPSFDRTGT